MADEVHVLRGIDWRETFSFTHIFRAFRIAVHPTKLALGLLFLLTFFVGGKILDGLWPDKYRAVPNEIAISQLGDRLDRSAHRADARQQAIDNYAELLDLHDVKIDGRTSREVALAGGGRGELLKKISEARDKEIADAVKTRDENIKTADETLAKAPEDQKAVVRERHDNAVRSSHEAFRSRRAAAFGEAAASKRIVDGVHGLGIFATFFNYETDQFENIVQGVIGWNWLAAGPGTPAVLPSLWNFVAVGPTWLIQEHFIFFIVLTILFLATWSYFGGAIARIAAVHVARDEKISFKTARQFAGGKILSFAFAPLIPLLIVLVLWALVWLLGVVGNIPGVGPVVVGILFFLVLIAAGAMALMLIGLVGGFNLMYPTIAVEGSDSFDAISRSFSYLYAKPWRMLFYTAVALVYGALTYLFVRFFVYLMLALAHGALGAGIWSDAASGEPLLNAMWTRPALDTLTHPIETWQLGGGQTIGAYLINIWVYIAVALVGAFAISFYFSAHTIIYYLMRREVDATEMDDVFIEQPEDEFNDALDTATVVTTASAGTLATAAPVVEDSSTPGGNVAESPLPAAGESGATQTYTESPAASSDTPPIQEERPYGYSEPSGDRPPEDRPDGQ